LRYLSGYADVFLGCVADQPWEQSDLEVLKQYCADVFVSRLSVIGRWISGGVSCIRGRAITEGAFYSSELADKVGEWTGVEFDGAVLFCSSMAQYMKFFDKRPRRVILDLVDVDSQKWLDYSASVNWPMGWLYKLESSRVHRIEKQYEGLVDSVCVVSPDEVGIYKSRHPGRNIFAISNGVDYEYFDPNSIPSGICGPFRKSNPQLVFMGVLDYWPNVQGLVWFCETVLPLLRSNFPDLGLDIVGRNPTEEVRRLKNTAGVRVIGEVPDVRPYLMAADFGIAPLQIARGVQNKILECLSCGLPVIASTKAAIGIEKCYGLSVADDPDQWVDVLRSLQLNSEMGDYRQATRLSIIKNYSWESKLSLLKTLLDL
jgi:sugar transferase (PEP-CTERM/EpsH1 system associated)